MFRSELNRAFRNKFLVIVIIITTCSMVYSFVDSWRFYQIGLNNPHSDFHPYYYNAYEVFLLSLQSLTFISFAILSATLPYADSLIVDRESGYIRYAIFRAGYWRFLLSKLVANWLVGATVVALSMLLAFGIACLLFPIALPPLYIDEIKVSIVGIPHTPFGATFESTPGLYILGRIGLGFLFGGAYATLGFAISSLTRNRYVALSGPLIIFLVAMLLFHLFGLYGWIPVVAITPEMNLNSSSITILGNYLAVYVGSLLTMFIVFSKNWFINRQRTV